MGRDRSSVRVLAREFPSGPQTCVDFKEAVTQAAREQLLV